MYLGIDCGTQGTKVLILDSESGQTLGLGAAPHTLIQGEHGRREQDTGQWLHALQEATRQALAEAGVSGQQIQGIGVSGQQHGLVLLDRHGEVLRPAKLFRSARDDTKPCCHRVPVRNRKIAAPLDRVTGSMP